MDFLIQDTIKFLKIRGQYEKRGLKMYLFQKGSEVNKCLDSAFGGRLT